jgi:predicted nucleic acid-binding protein
VRLEAIGHTMREGYVEQLHYYLEFFKGVSFWATDLKAVVDKAIGECMSTPIDSMDALHVAAAVLVGADELVTTEKPGRGRNITRTVSLPVVSIHSAGRPNPTAGKPPAG